MNNFKALTQFIQPQALSLLTRHLLQAMQSGHVCLDLNDDFFLQECEDDVHTYIQTLKSHPQSLYNDWIGDATQTKPIIHFNNKLFLHRYFNYEKGIVHQIQALIQKENINERAEALKDSLQKISPALRPQGEDIDWQWIAIIAGFLQKFTIITGGPGTGKTSTVNRLIYLLLCNNPQLNIKIVAPTGKAASRLKESQLSLLQLGQNAPDLYELPLLEKISEIPCSTIHALLGYIPNSIHFKHNASQPLDIDVLIIDESSMIDIQLFYKLMQAIDTSRTQVIMLGDKNQLASVEMGNIFGELCDVIDDKNQFNEEYINIFKSYFNPTQIPSTTSASASILQNHIIELSKSYRFRDDKGIGQLSKAVLDNKPEQIEHLYHNPTPEVQFRAQLDFQEIYNQLTAPGAYFDEHDIINALAVINKYKILVAQNNGIYGVHEINRKIEMELLKHGKIKKCGKFYHNQIILITKNQPQLDIYNGDIGLIREVTIHDNETVLLAFFEHPTDGYKTVIPLEINAYQSAFCMTIHKSQGSEFEHVAIILPEHDHEELLNKDILYTAITRAKQRLSIYGQLPLILDVSARKFHRSSGLSHHLKS